ncbi:hypothetical protein H4R35_000472 [Dimargaris xerosporica]|nr:hypothetical protein H4R35_000472 [Dimargaris xerosporica]
MLKRMADSYRRYVDAKPRARGTVEPSPAATGDPGLDAETEHQAQALYHKIMANLDALESDLEASSASDSDEAPPAVQQLPESEETPAVTTDPGQLVYVCSLCPGKQMPTLAMAEDHFRSKLHQRRLAQFEKQQATEHCPEPPSTNLPTTETEAATSGSQPSSLSLVPQDAPARLPNAPSIRPKKSTKSAKGAKSARRVEVAATVAH